MSKVLLTFSCNRFSDFEPAGTALNKQSPSFLRRFLRISKPVRGLILLQAIVK